MLYRPRDRCRASHFTCARVIFCGVIKIQTPGTLVNRPTATACTDQVSPFNIIKCTYMYLSCDDDHAQKHGNVISKIIARMTETTKEHVASCVIYLRIVLSIYGYVCMRTTEYDIVLTWLCATPVFQYRHFN